MSLSHSYNGNDDRISTTTISAATATPDTRRFVYAPDGRVLGEYGTSASDVRAEFIWLSPQVGDGESFGGDDGLGGYMPLAVAANDNSAGPQLLWVHANHMGVPAVYTDTSGAAINAPSGYNAPGFPGQSRTPGLGGGDLYYNRYRDYDSTTGRYIQADPIGLAGGASPYSYAMNSPLRYTDPTGEIVQVLAFCALNPAPCTLAVTGGIALGYSIYNYYANMPDEYRLYPRLTGQFCPPVFFRDTGGNGRSGGGGISIPNGGNDETGDECEKEWADAFKMCRDLLNSPDPALGITGGYKNPYDCARGLVSQDCGGNRVTPNNDPYTPRNRPRKWRKR